MKKLIRNIFYFFVVYIWVLWFCTREILGNITTEQILFHIQWAHDNFDFDLSVVKKVFLMSLFITVAVFLIILICFIVLFNNIRDYKVLQKLSYIPLIMVVILIFIICKQTDILGIIKSGNDDFIKDHYIKPVVINNNKIKPKNLVLIYIESLEQTYKNTSLFQENLLQSLDNLPGFEFKNYIQTPNSEWTMAAIVGGQCGIPLKPVLIGKEPSNAIGALSKQFLPSVICLADVLKSAGYYNFYMQGASLKFAGKDKFLQSHGYDNIFGREEWLATKYTTDDLSEWGLYDDLLIQEAKITLDNLVKSKKLFNLTILTLDTHFPDGYLSKTCKNAGGKTFQDIIKCSANEVASFIKYIIDKGYLEHTNVVILGDHLTMPNAIFDLVEKEPKRSIYNKWITKDNFEANRHEITHFDIAPTILDFIGLGVVQGRFGLGHSAFGKNINNYNPAIIDEYCMHLNKQSLFYNNLWKVSDKNNHNFAINVQ